MPVEGSDADIGAFGNGISRRLATNFQNQLDSDVDQSLPVLSRISPHRAPTTGCAPTSLTFP